MPKTASPRTARIAATERLAAAKSSIQQASRVSDALIELLEAIESRGPRDIQGWPEYRRAAELFDG